MRWRITSIREFAVACRKIRGEGVEKTYTGPAYRPNAAVTGYLRQSLGSMRYGLLDNRTGAITEMLHAVEPPAVHDPLSDPERLPCDYVGAKDEYRDKKDLAEAIF